MHQIYLKQERWQDLIMNSNYFTWKDMEKLKCFAYKTNFILFFKLITGNEYLVSCWKIKTISITYFFNAKLIKIYCTII